jgi:cellobiose phosphorylase
VELAVARNVLKLYKEAVKKFFGKLTLEDKHYDIQFLDTIYENIVVLGAFDSLVPAIKELYKDEFLAQHFDGLEVGYSYFYSIEWEEQRVLAYVSDGVKVHKKSVDEEIGQRIIQLCKAYKMWAGRINEEGEHIINLRHPVPGPHFYTNMLLGNRMKFPFALQSTPKSVVDRLGGGSFRAHAATQVLATRWDYLPEENGFPANRQFYIVEKGRQIFYSADITDKNIKTASCIHGQNNTRLVYETYCGLHIERMIFLLPQYENLPVATEVQRIKITNLGQQNRQLKVVVTGMLGTSATHALMEDVVYSTVIMQGKVFHDEKGNILAYTPSYYPAHAKGDVRFTTVMAHEEGKKKYARELCTQYGEFIGSGTLLRPEGAAKLSNRLSTKGPGFFAMSASVEVKAVQSVTVDHFVGLISTFNGEEPTDLLVKQQIDGLHKRFSEEWQVEQSLLDQLEGYKKYRAYLQIHTKDIQFDTYVNKNLPFQVLYQTFVSRSFDLTQKGYREIGFREIQDIFGSMYYLISMGEIEYTKALLQEWISKVLEFGYCYHNFFWHGKEAGKWSDDGLWLVQAVYRFVSYTGDDSFLDAVFDIPETGGKKRSVYETLQAVIKYSAEVSVGSHGLPLIDHADWNDCLKVDEEAVKGAEKEEIYLKTGEFLNNQSESVMNAFLLKVAMEQTLEFAKIKDDHSYYSKLQILKDKLSQNIQRYTWKEDFYARVLFNRFENEITFLGADGDGFSADSKINGTYFLNSFSWSILAKEATENQIEIMLNRIEKYLKTPYGIKLMSPTDLSKVAKKTATGEYFPGDRENGGVFKHAAMMATAAMIQAAQVAENRELAQKLSDTAYWMMDLTLPYHTLEKPFETGGNPRWCTQYNNSETGENIGPTLSGTSTWLFLTLTEMLGIKYERERLILDPILRNQTLEIYYDLRFFDAVYEIHITKPEGFYRIKDSQYHIEVDGVPIAENGIKLINDYQRHRVEMRFETLE